MLATCYGIDGHSPEFVSDLFLSSPQATHESTPEYSSPLHTVHDGQPTKYKAGTAGRPVHGFIQYIGGLTVQQLDIVSTWQQHIQLITNCVYMLPIEICRWLLTNQPTSWQQYTVIPIGTTTALDAQSGLDTLNVASTGVWGVDQYRVPYFSPDGDIGQNDGAYITIDSNGGVVFNQ